ncbi:MAG: molybdopterin-guanine dinucleotide biosynthesis protein B [Thaumarchaeota archaeon]|nr:molybdopterin-guanine dinucleotide biosynthesis protein B [Nitrososphaerota archaeon]
MPKLKIVSFLGYKESGKTTALEHVCRKLTLDGWKVGTIKHIHESEFTIDHKGKDTWRHARAGASVVVSVSKKELAVIRKCNTSEVGLESIFKIFKAEHMDFVLIEGYYKKLAKEKRRNITRILCAKNTEDALELLHEHLRPICICGKIAESTAKDLLGTPFAKFPRDKSKVMRLIGRP